MNGSQDPVTAAVFVSVEIDWDALEPGVYFDPKGGQAEAIDISPETQRGAVYGVNFAREKASTLPCAVRIKEIHGSETRRNPTLVAAATAHAMWEALGYMPDLETVQHVESTVLRSQATPNTPLLHFE
jgi:hypothetical protein